MFSLLMKLRPFFFFQADPPAGGTPTADPGKAADPPANEGDPDPKAVDDTKDKKPKPPIQWTADQQAEIDRINAETRKQERKKAEAEFEAKAAKAKKEAEDQALTEKQEFKTLAENRAAEIETLKGEIETLTEAQKQGEKYKAVLEKHLKEQTAKLPKHIQTLLSKMDVLEQMEYLTENAKDLGVKLDSIDETPRDENTTDADLLKSQNQEVRSFVKSIT